VPTALTERIHVHLSEIDEMDAVILRRSPE
jgi:hypothetical protein